MKSKLTTNQCNCADSLIDVTGLCDSSNVIDVISEFPYWQQMYVNETLIIPEEKPDVEQINSVDISIEIIRSEVIKTPISFTNDTPPLEEPNLEGKLLTGRKVIVEGKICQKIIYTADDPSQPVHSAHFYIPFSSYIVVPKEVTFTNQDGTTTVVDSLDVNYSINSCVEEVYAYLVDERRIFKQVVLLLYAVPTQS